MEKITFPARLQGWLWLMCLLMPLAAGAQAPDSSAWTRLIDIKLPPGQQRDSLGQSSDPSFYRVLFLFNKSQAPVGVSGLSAGALTNEATGDTVPLALTVNGKAAMAKATDSLAPGAMLRVEMRASVRDSGDWFYVLTGSVRQRGTDNPNPIFLQGGVRQSIRPMDKAKARPFFEIEDISTLNVSWGVPLMRVYIRDTSGAGGKLGLPQVIVRKELSEGAFEQARYGGVTFWSEEGDSISEVKLGPGQGMAVMVRFDALRSPGKYAGKLVVDYPGMIVVEEDFTLNIRSSLWLAIAIILLGVLGGYWMNRLLNQTKPRLQMAQQVAQLGEDYAQLGTDLGKLDDEETLVLNTLRNQTSRLSAQLNTSVPADAEDRLKRLNAKLPLFVEWVKTDRLIESVQPASLVTQEITDLVGAAQTYLLDPNADSAQADAQKSALAGIPAKLDAAIGTNMQSQVAALKALADNHQDDLGDTYAGIAARITALEADVASGAVSLSQMQSQYDGIRKDITKALTAQLQTQAETSPIQGVDASEWSKAKASIQPSMDNVAAATTADTAISAYHSACLKYLAQVFLVLTQKVASREEGADAATKATLDEIKAQSAEINTNLAAGDVDVARQLINDAVAKFNALGSGPQETTRGADTFMAKAGGILPPLPPFMQMAGGMQGGYRSPIGIGSRDQMSMKSLADINRQLMVADLISTFAIAVLSTLMGLLTLYLPDYSWGGLEDYIYAFLWGFGLHTVTKSTDVGTNVFGFLSGKLTTGSTAAPASGGQAGGDAA